MPDPYLICPACDVAFDMAETRRSDRGLRCPNCGEMVEARGGRLPRSTPIQVWLASVLLLLPGPPTVMLAYWQGPRPEYLWASLVVMAVLVLLAAGLLARLSTARWAAQLGSLFGAGMVTAAVGYVWVQAWAPGAARMGWLLYSLVYIVPAVCWCAGVFALLQVKPVRRWFARPYRFDDVDE